MKQERNGNAVTLTPENDLDMEWLQEHVGAIDKHTRVECGTCPHWHGGQASLGECRIRAPALAYMGPGTWPMTMAQSWCAEHPAFAILDVSTGQRIRFASTREVCPH